MIEQIKKEVLDLIEQYKNTAEDHFDFWNEHIKYVRLESLKLADLYGADKEIVELGALLHDIALIKKVGDRASHHVNGAIIAREILQKYDYPSDKLERVVKCVFNHRSSKNATSIEETCVCDADIIAHFDNIPMLFNLAYNKYNRNLNDVRDWLKTFFEKDFNDLSSKTKKIYKEEYDLIYKTVIEKE